MRSQEARDRQTVFIARIVLAAFIVLLATFAIDRIT
jgi:hypothetical protein